MGVSHETIYLSLFVQSRGALRRELCDHLRSGRCLRRPPAQRSKHQGQGQIPDKVMISERPAEVLDRAVPATGRGTSSWAASRPGSRPWSSARRATCSSAPFPTATQRRRFAMRSLRSIAALPQQLRRSLTWDRGKEMLEHVWFTVDSGVQIYFCEPHSPWQRGSNENTNGLLRQYLPKRTDLNRFTQRQLDAIAQELNGRPRQTLGWAAPTERLAEVFA